MQLFLTGGGDQEVFRHLDKCFIDSLPDSAQVAILPHACDDYNDVLERIEQDFSHKKIASFDLFLSPSSALLDYDALMIEGGNTFELIKSIRDSAFFDLIKKFAHQNKPIYADSAGAIMLGEDIQTAFLGDDADSDHLKLQDYRGLGLLRGWTVHAHATSDEFEDLNDLLYTKGNPILAFGEECGVAINGSDLTVYGRDPLEIFDFSGRRSVFNGKSISL